MTNNKASFWGMQFWNSTLGAAKRFVDLRQLHSFLLDLWSPDLRLTLLLCIPGALVATALRVWLLWHMPAGFVHGDTAAQLSTALKLLESGYLDINGKKTFLTPLLYTISALAHIPVLYFAAILQHLFGVVLVVCTGLLTKAWFLSWRLWIVPLTVLIAINPILLWYEHTALPESMTVFGAMAVALTGTLFFRRPNRYTLTLLFLSVLFVAGARPEGRFFSLFALALVIRRYWGDWSRLKIYAAVSVAWVFLIFLLTRTAQSGLLLYASLIHWSPAHLAVAPGVAEAMQPFQARAIKDWETHSFHHNRLRKDMFNAMVEHRMPRRQVNATFQKAGIEIALRNFWRLPSLAIRKFFIAHRESPALGFSDYAIKGQLRSLYLVNRGTHAAEYSALLWGVRMATIDEARPFLEANYDVSAGEKLTHFLDAFVQAELYPIVSMEMPGTPLKGIPWLYVFALTGAICLIVRDRPVIGLQLLWFLFLFALFILLMVTGNVRARYRLIFEPFWFIYLFGLLDTVVLLFQNGLNRERHIGGSGRPKEQGRPLPSGKCAKPPKASVMSHSRLLAANNTEPNPLNALLFRAA